MRRALENTTGCSNQRRPLGRIERVNRRALLLEQQQVGNDAVGLYGTFAERKSLRRLESRLDLHDILLCELLKICPTEIARYLECCGKYRTAVVRTPLHDLAFPLGIEQVSEAFRSVLLLYQIGVIANRTEH